MQECSLKLDTNGTVECQVEGRKLLLTVDTAYELQYTLAAFLAELELQEDEIPEEPMFRETKDMLNVLSAHKIRNFDA